MLFTSSAVACVVFSVMGKVRCASFVPPSDAREIQGGGAQLFGRLLNEGKIKKNDAKPPTVCGCAASCFQPALLYFRLRLLPPARVNTPSETCFVSLLSFRVLLVPHAPLYFVFSGAPDVCNREGVTRGAKPFTFARTG